MKIRQLHILRTKYAICKIMCKPCNKRYVGETGRSLTQEPKNTKKNVKTAGRFTRTQKEKAEQDQLNQSSHWSFAKETITSWTRTTLKSWERRQTQQTDEGGDRDQKAGQGHHQPLLQLPCSHTPGALSSRNHQEMEGVANLPGLSGPSGWLSL